MLSNVSSNVYYPHNAVLAMALCTSLSYIEMAEQIELIFGIEASFDLL